MGSVRGAPCSETQHAFAGEADNIVTSQAAVRGNAVRIGYLMVAGPWSESVAAQSGFEYHPQ